MKKKRINFGVMLQGAGCNMNAWRHPSVPKDASVNLDFYVDRALKAEAAGIDFVFIADGLYIHEKSFAHFLNRFEPIAILSALAVATSKIGLVGTVSTSYSDPFTVARQLASIDALSGGRAGWNSVTSPLEGSGRNYNRALPDHAERYEMAYDYTEAIIKLWDSWDDDAFIRDVETGKFFDKAKMHRADHHGKYFSVEGPLSIGRSAQGRPVIFQAGSSKPAIQIAGKYADAVFTNGGEFEKGQAFYKKIKQSAREHGRRGSDVKIFPGIGPVVGATEEDAQRKAKEIRDLVTVEDGLNYLSHHFDQHDFTVYPLDEPFPDLKEVGRSGFQSTTDEIKNIARERGHTLRQVALETATIRAHIGTSESMIGTPEKIADELIKWVDEGAADGFMLGLPVMGFGLDDFTEMVLPILAERGYHDSELEGDTLRDHFGLPFRESQYAEPSPEKSSEPSKPIEVKVTPPDCQDAQWCVQQYFEEISERFEAGFDPERSLEIKDADMVPPSGYFVMASQDGKPVGCGALKAKDSGTAEIKRMWTADGARRSGVAHSILSKLETLAKESGYRTLHLESNRSLNEALAFYRKEGYKEVPAFNKETYAHFWFEKHL